MNISKLLIIVLSFLTISCEEGVRTPVTTGGNQNQPSVTITGYVRDALTDSTIEGATISSDNDLSSVSFSDGRYVLLVNPGNRTITASADGYRDYEKVFTAETDSQYTIDFSLTLSPAKITGEVFYRAAPYPPIPNAQIACAGNETYTDSEGVYELEIPAGTHSVYVTAQDYFPANDRFTIVAGEILRLNFPLYRP